MTGWHLLYGLAVMTVAAAIWQYGNESEAKFKRKRDTSGDGVGGDFSVADLSWQLAHHPGDASVSQDCGGNAGGSSGDASCDSSGSSP